MLASAELGDKRARKMPRWLSGVPGAEPGQEINAYIAAHGSRDRCPTSTFELAGLLAV
jgi:hypothetical protein